MRFVRKNSTSLTAIAFAVVLAGAAAVMAQKETTPTLPEPNAATELSTSFRTVAKNSLPSIVSIQTRGKAMRMTNGNMDNLPFDDEDSPLGEMFRNNPQFREFFRNRGNQRMPAPRGMGSGFIIDSKGIILTNSHVVRDAEEVRVKLYDGREFIGTDIKTDPRTDVAVIRIDATGLQAVPMGDSEAMQIGDWVLAIGSPFGLDMSVTSGIISAKGRGPGITEREDFLQTDAAINPGNSGGPLFNLSGEVIGINTAISTRSGGYDGIGFAIPINMAKWVANQLVEKGEVSRAYLGVGIQPVDSSLAKKLKVEVGQGALVNHVMPKSPAANAKIEIEDLILELNGQVVKGARELQGIVEQLVLGKEYPVVVLRNGEKITLTVKAEAMPQNYSRESMREEQQEQEEGATNEESAYDELGLDVKLLTPEMAKRLDIPSSSRGIVIAGVKEDSAAERAGLRPGYVIERVGKTPVTSVGEYRTALKEQSLKEGVSLLVNGGGGTRFIVIQQN
ncbi:MAG: Do family serine endopeptidase [Planctomycetaceae bacterium]